MIAIRRWSFWGLGRDTGDVRVTVVQGSVDDEPDRAQPGAAERIANDRDRLRRADRMRMDAEVCWILIGAGGR